MTNRLVVAATVLLSLWTSSAAHAGALTNATWTQVTQGFGLTRTGAQLSLTGASSSQTSIAVGLSYPAFSTRFAVPKTVNGVVDLLVSITQGGPQMLTANPASAMADVGIPGAVTIRTAAHNSKGVNQSTYMFNGVFTVVMVPLSVGVAGQFMTTFIVIGALHTLTVDYFAWTPGLLQFTGLTSFGKALPNVTAAGTWNLTPGGGGTVTLVSPTKVSVTGNPFKRRTATFASLKLYFVPEPSTLLLLGAGALGLLLRGRKG